MIAGVESLENRLTLSASVVGFAPQHAETMNAVREVRVLNVPGAGGATVESGDSAGVKSEQESPVAKQEAASGDASLPARPPVRITPVTPSVGVVTPRVAGTQETPIQQTAGGTQPGGIRTIRVNADAAIGFNSPVRIAMGATLTSRLSDTLGRLADGAKNATAVMSQPTAITPNRTVCTERRSSE